MKKKSVSLLVIVTAVVVIAAGYAVVSRQSAVTRTVVEETVFPDLIGNINDVTALEITGEEQSFQVRHDGAQWVVSALADFPAEFDRVKKALLELGELKTVEAKTADPKRYGDLGLNEPGSEEGAGMKVRVLGAEESIMAAAILGDDGRGTTDLVYLRRDGEDQTWVVRTKPNIGGDPRDWVDTMLMKIDLERVQRISLAHADGEEVGIYKTEPGDEQFLLKDVPIEASIKSPISMDSIARVISVLRFEEVFAAGDIPADREPDTVGTFQTFDGATIAISLFVEEEAVWAKVAAAYDADAVLTPDLVAQDDGAPEDVPSDGEGEEISEEPAPEEIDVEAEIAGIIARTEKWAFKLPDFKVEQLQTRNEKLLSFPEPEPDPNAAPESDAPPSIEDLIPRVPGITE